jgi:hypothetical protein
MSYSFQINNRDPAIRRPARGRCIYCDTPDYRPTRDRRLGDEHIIAEGLGGNLILREAVCEACETAVKRFEPGILKTVLYAPRVHLGVRRKKRKRNEERIKISGVVDGKDVTIDLPLKRTPVVLFFVRLGPPGILVGRGNAPQMVGAWFTHLNSQENLSPPGFQSFASPILDTFKFSQFLAKIAHGFAIDAFGEEFTPVLLEMIKEEKPSDPRYDLIGGADESSPSDYLHELTAEWQPANGTQYAVVKIRLFGNLGAPSYFVVAGPAKASSANNFARRHQRL